VFIFVIRFPRLVILFIALVSVSALNLAEVEKMSLSNTGSVAREAISAEHGQTGIIVSSQEQNFIPLMPCNNIEPFNGNGSGLVPQVTVDSTPGLQWLHGERRSHLSGNLETQTRAVPLELAEEL
jgi:hypothetical protein